MIIQGFLNYNFFPERVGPIGEVRLSMGTANYIAMIKRYPHGSTPPHPVISEVPHKKPESRRGNLLAFTPEPQRRPWIMHYSPLRPTPRPGPQTSDQPKRCTPPPSQPYRPWAYFLLKHPGRAAADQSGWRAASGGYLNFQGDADAEIPPVFQTDLLFGCMAAHP